MKTKGIAFSLLTAICLGAVGCGAEEYKITASSATPEHGYVTGGGSYTMGSTVGLKIYSNLGCTLQSIKFVNSNGDMEEYTDFDAIENKYHYYDFVVSDKTIGHYEPQYDCSVSNSPQSYDIQSKYTVAYKVDLNADNVYEYDKFDEISAGSKVPNILYIENGGIYYSVEWYTSKDKNEESKYEFDKIITKDMTLYGMATQMNSAAIVEAALLNLYDSNKISVKGNSQQINMQNYRNSDEFIFDYFKNEKLSSMLRKVAGNNKGQHDFIYVEGDVQSKTRINSASSYKLDDIKESYVNEFLILEDFISNKETNKEYTISTDYTISSQGDYLKVKDNYHKIESENRYNKNASNEYEVNEDGLYLKVGEEYYEIKKEQTYSMFKLVNKTDGEEYYLTMDTNFNISKFNKNNIDYSVTYNQDVNQTVKVTGTSGGFYTFRLTSDDEELKTFLESYNTIDKVIKVVPDRGETLASVLPKYTEIFNKLNKYAYTLHLYNENAVEGDKFSANTFDATTSEGLNDHKYIGVKVLTKTETLINAYEKLKDGNYTITTKVITELGPQEKIWSANGVDITTATDRPDDMLNVVWTSLENIKGLQVNAYYKIDYDTDSQEISVYLNEENVESAFAELKVKLNGDASFNTIKYTVTKDGTITTYTNTFEYVVTP